MVLPLTHFRGSHPVLVVRLALLGLADRRDPRHEVGNADVRRPKKSPKIGQLDLKVNHFFLSLEFRETAMPLEIKIFVEIIDFTLSRLNQCHAESKSWQSPNAVFRN